MTASYLPPVLLSSRHVVDVFECRSQDQTHWLRRHARQSAATAATRVLVVTSRNSTEVVAYYAWCTARNRRSGRTATTAQGSGALPPSRSLCWLAWE